MEPAIKKCKTEQSSNPRRTLSIELIAFMACYASTAGKAEENDLQNILVAVGPRQVSVLRHTYLFKNMGYLSRCLNLYLSRIRPAHHEHNLAFKLKLKSNILTWMEVNAENWKQLCTKENVENYANLHVRSPSSIPLANDPLVLFNNPAVAIDYGLVEVLIYLVEEMKIAIDSFKWNCHIDASRYNLVAMAMGRHSYDIEDHSIECLEYLLRIDGINIHADKAWSGEMGDPLNSLIIQAAASNCISSDALAALIRHESFDQNPANVSNVMKLPLAAAAYMPMFLSLDNKKRKDMALKKTKLLLKAGADPNFVATTGESPISLLKKVFQEMQGRSNIPMHIKKLRRKYYEDVVALMEDRIRNRGTEN